ncbi:unnamed protein product [Tilletia laevis]|uniref:Uncharacterized protein n=3 Tax=Tilletia TaxID=13289 RepID=A0A9N8MIF2_9BASI|nr:hypothetical protein CF336_g3429 [Tilletia laevis]CAD6893765.1 unnamed protein product [Tilletia caries]KAE8204677.1 hypothetical protein CF335_g2568 [Tilletia laevis]CAD6935465.1 unnamed protein product [Tilletia caries]CAD6936909.1 unnamed protein product [Tilletia caries]
MQDPRSSSDLTDATLTPSPPVSSLQPQNGSRDEKDEVSVAGRSVYETPAEGPQFLFSRAPTSRSIPLAPTAQSNESVDDVISRDANSDAEGDGEQAAEKKPADQDEDDESKNKVDWDDPNDPQNPQNFSLRYKWGLTLLVSLLTLNVALISSDGDRFAVRSDHGPVSTHHLGILVGLLRRAVHLERFFGDYGRRPIFVISFAGYALFILGQALAKNPETLLITRFLSGVFASAPLTNSGGLIADIHDAKEKGKAITVFTAAVFCGPSLGPIVGSFIVQEWRWEGVFWVLLAFAGVCWLLIVALLPETFAPVLLAKKAKRLRKEQPEKYEDCFAEHEKMTAETSTLAIIKKTVVTPFKIMSLEVMLILITIYLSVAYAILYSLFESFVVIFIDIHGMSMGIGSLRFLAILVGSIIGAAFNIVLNHRYRYLQHFWKGSPPPEERVYGAILAGPLLVAGSFALGWTGYKASITPWGAIISAIPLGTAITLVFISLQSFIIDAYGANSASALAGNTIIRSAVAGAFPLFTTQFFKGLGVNWAASIIGWIALALAPIPLLFYLYGPRIRKTGSSFAPCTDLKIRTQLEEEGHLPKDSYRALWGEARTGIKEARRQLLEEERSQKEGESKEQA